MLNQVFNSPVSQRTMNPLKLDMGNQINQQNPKTNQLANYLPSNSQSNFFQTNQNTPKTKLNNSNFSPNGNSDGTQLRKSLEVPGLSFKKRGYIQITSSANIHSSMSHNQFDLTINSAEMLNNPAKFFENYLKVENEMERKRNRLNELKIQMENTRFSNDETHVINLQNAIKKTRDDLNFIRLKNKQIETEKFEQMAILKNLEKDISEIEKKQKQNLQLSKPFATLQRELNKLNSECNNLVTALARKEFEQSKEIDNDYRAKTKNKLFGAFI